MCGFAGYLSFQNCDHQEILQRMGLAIAHRGPDSSAVWFDEERGIGLSHRRLAILDLSDAGSQPMISTGGRYVLAYNGEVYNFKEIRQELEREFGSIIWRGHSDTEVILYGFESWGLGKTLKKMVGMFALALWDRQDKKIFLARDRMGEKPLYFGWQNQTFLFGSELKALKIHPDFENEIAADALAAYFKYNYIPSGSSIYKGIQKLIPGTYCSVSLQDKMINHASYWQITDHIHNYTDPTINEPSSHVNSLESLLKDAVKKQMIADVPLGAFLSGGIDSSLIASLMQCERNQPIKTFTMGFNEKRFDEASYAKRIAAHLGTDHTEMYVGEQELMNVIPALPEIYDEPFSDASQIPTFLVSKLARTSVTVSLSGDGGDELFSGYGKYLRLQGIWEKLTATPHGIRKQLASIILSQNTRRWNKWYAALQPVVPTRMRIDNFGEKMHRIARLANSTSQSELHNQYISHWRPNEILVNPPADHFFDLAKVDNLSFIEKMLILDAETYLRDDILVKVDRAAMANSLEVRIPLLDHRVVEFALNTPLNLKIKQGRGKWILREILSRYIPKSLVDRPKMGFSVPLDVWLRGPLKEWTLDILSDSSLAKHGLLNTSLVQNRLQEHMSGAKNWHNELWDVLMFQTWYNNQSGTLNKVDL